MKSLLIDAAEDADVFDLDLSAIFERGDGHTMGQHMSGGTISDLTDTQCVSRVNTTCMRTCGGTTGVPCAC
ncbi:hypothetical protein [Phytohabitans suffuscus]|uniref:Uncharacterized protein n=1 Tax=Phytohabitans suffuscus TaxID=624315 RepID=A0A6F8YFU9_9ACTN|nr:hypothetical protein [Phytohabitans suffuscus]BCB84995.1 hypothetical protein Psuf_023080 [Phytohabitans suffuscus]